MHRILWSLGGEVTLPLILLQLSSPKVWIEDVVEMEGAVRGEPIPLTQLCLGKNLMPNIPHGAIKLLGDTSPAQLSGF